MGKIFEGPKIERKKPEEEPQKKKHVKKLRGGRAADYQGKGTVVEKRQGKQIRPAPKAEEVILFDDLEPAPEIIVPPETTPLITPEETGEEEGIQTIHETTAKEGRVTTIDPKPELTEPEKEKLETELKSIKEEERKYQNKLTYLHGKLEEKNRKLKNVFWRTFLGEKIENDIHRIEKTIGQINFQKLNPLNARKKEILKQLGIEVSPAEAISSDEPNLALTPQETELAPPELKIEEPIDSGAPIIIERSTIPTTEDDGIFEDNYPDGRLRTRMYPDGSAEFYDEEGNVEYRDTEGKVTRRCDAKGNDIEEPDPSNEIVEPILSPQEIVKTETIDTRERLDHLKTQPIKLFEIPKTDPFPDKVTNNSITTEEWEEFVRTGNVSDVVLNNIAQKLIRGEGMSPEETAIYSNGDNGQKIEDLLLINQAIEIAETIKDPEKRNRAFWEIGKNAIGSGDFELARNIIIQKMDEKVNQYLRFRLAIELARRTPEITNLELAMQIAGTTNTPEAEIPNLLPLIEVAVWAARAGNRLMAETAINKIEAEDENYKRELKEEIESILTTGKGTFTEEGYKGLTLEQEQVSPKRLLASIKQRHDENSEDEDLVEPLYAQTTPPQFSSKPESPTRKAPKINFLNPKIKEEKTEKDKEKERQKRNQEIIDALNIAIFEKEGEKGGPLTPEEKQALAQEILLKAREDQRKEELESKSFPKRAGIKAEKWWTETLEKTKLGKAAKIVMSSALIGAATLASASFLGVAPAGSMATRLLARIAITTGMNMALTSERATGLSYKIGEKIKEWKAKKQNKEVQPAEEKPFYKEHGKNILLATGIGSTFLFSGGIMALAVGGGMVARRAFNTYIDKKIKEKEAKIIEIEGKREEGTNTANPNFDINTFLNILIESDEELSKINSNLKKLKWGRELANGALTMGTGVATMAVIHGGHSGGILRKIYDNGTTNEKVKDENGTVLDDKEVRENRKILDNKEPKIKEIPATQQKITEVGDKTTPITKPAPIEQLKETPKVEPPAPTTKITPGEIAKDIKFVHKGEGIEHTFRRQIEQDPALAKSLGFKGDIKDPNALREFSGGAAHRIALEKGYVGADGTQQVGITQADKVAFELKADGDGNAIVTEKGADGKVLATLDNKDGYKFGKTEDSEFQRTFETPKNTETLDAVDKVATKMSVQTTEDEKLIPDEAKKKELLEKLREAMDQHKKAVEAEKIVTGTTQEPPVLGLTPKQDEIINSNPLFKNNNYNLAKEKLFEAHNVHERNIKTLFPEGGTRKWSDVSIEKVTTILKKPGMESSPIVQHINRLHTITGLKPGGLLGLNQETTEEYIARATQQAAKNGSLREITASLKTDPAKVPEEFKGLIK